MNRASIEALGGVRVHLAPVQGQQTVRKKSAQPLEVVVTSPNGFLSCKDSGGMFYVIRLAQKKAVLAFGT